MSMPFTVLATLISLTALPLSLQTATQTEAAEVEAPVAVEETVTAQPVRPIDIVGAERDALLAEIATALGNVETAKGRFFQMGADDSLSEGDFYLRRPGRMRFEYDAPTPLLIVADGATVAIEDRDLETQDRVPLTATPLAMILDDEINFQDEVEVLEVRKGNGAIAIVMQDIDGEVEGTLALVLDAENYDLLQWRTVDATGGVTSVQLAGIKTGVRINPRLFRIEELGEEDERD